MADVAPAIDLSSERARQSPFESYVHVRRLGPLYIDPATGKRYLGRYAEIREVLRDADHFSSRLSGVEGTFMGADEQAYATRIKAIRGMVRVALSTKKVAALEKCITVAAEQAVESALRQKEFECRAALSGVVPAGAISAMFGIEGENTERFMRWTEAVLLLGRSVRRANQNQTGFGPLARLRELRRSLRPTALEKDLDECIAFMREHFAIRQQEVVNAWVAESMITFAESSDLDAEGMVDIALGFMVAAAESTTSLITTAVLILAKDVNLQEYVRSGDRPAALFVDEVLRYESPVQRRRRYVRSDCEVLGVALKEGETINLLIGSANRDPEAFSEPDRFNGERDPNPHLAFGFGPRSCPGSQLGHLEAKAVMNALVRHSSRFELARPDEALRYPANLSLRGPRELFVRAS